MITRYAAYCLEPTLDNTGDIGARPVDAQPTLASLGVSAFSTEYCLRPRGLEVEA